MVLIERLELVGQLCWVPLNSTVVGGLIENHEGDHRLTFKTKVLSCQVPRQGINTMAAAIHDAINSYAVVGGIEEANYHHHATSLDDTWQLNPLPVAQQRPLAKEVTLHLVDDQLAGRLIFDANTTLLKVKQSEKNKSSTGQF